MLKPSCNESVVRRIKQYDPLLLIEWNRICNRWELWRKHAKRGSVFITRIQDPSGDYRPIDNRVLHYLINNDGWRYKNAMAIHREMLAYERAVEARKKRETEEYIEREVVPHALWAAKKDNL